MSYRSHASPALARTEVLEMVAAAVAASGGVASVVACDVEDAGSVKEAFEVARGKGSIEVR